MVLQLTVKHLHTIRADAENQYPQECCGLLLGNTSQTSSPTHSAVGRTAVSRTVVKLWPTPNNWNVAAAELTESPLNLTTARRYWIDPKDILEAQRYARNHQFDIIGVYHSHPDHPAVPSECDRVLAWSGYSYIIISVLQGSAQDLLSWSLDDHHQFKPEAVVLTG